MVKCVELWTELIVHIHKRLSLHFERPFIKERAVTNILPTFLDNVIVVSSCAIFLLIMYAVQSLECQFHVIHLGHHEKCPGICEAYTKHGTGIGPVLVRAAVNVTFLDYYTRLTCTVIQNSPSYQSIFSGFFFCQFMEHASAIMYQLFFRCCSSVCNGPVTFLFSGQSLS